jgi:acetyl-CoA C-acetyltransferase
MTNAVIVSTARTPLAKSWKGAFNMTHGATLGGHAVKHAIARAGIDAAEVEDVIMGCANPEGATGANIARQIALMADCPITVSGLTVNRFCSSGLQTIALAAQRVIAGEGDIYVAGGVESISCVQQEMNQHMLADMNLMKKKPEIYWNMLQTAEQVAKRYNISRERMDAYGAESQQKACAAQAAGKFNDEIAPITVQAGVIDKVMGMMTKQVTVSADEGLREGTTVESVSGIKPAMPGGVIAAGNASQFSDGAGACVVMSESCTCEVFVARCSTDNVKPLRGHARIRRRAPLAQHICTRHGESATTLRAGPLHNGPTRIPPTIPPNVAR